MTDDELIGERKIKLKEYIPLLQKTFSDESTKVILKIFSQNLPCSHCKNLLNPEEFAISKINKARMGRFTVCRKCHKEHYDNLKGML